ncbi:MAG: hypothetical protein BM564_09725 [Bacteroidetes bacterium MedPE-SWsnd-G2]|nr:MAG: hypothetical protein BM564_09725 [Bacteroidetes bacterium MedPE-SWsnd-G2]
MKNLYLLTLIFFTQLSFGQQPYYDNVDLDLTGLTLKSELASHIISTHTTFLTYSEAYQIIKDTDEDPNNSSNVLLMYNSQSESKDNTLGGGNVSNPEVWNREHTYPNSLGNPPLGTAGPGSDVHHLRACEANVNNNRGSLPFADGSGTYSNLGSSFYPGDSWKGDVARMMMYMYLRYGDQCLPATVGVGSAASTPDDMIDLFIEWNAEDPVSAIEIQRNNILETEQGNRNPFIDEPYLATIIWGGTPAQDIWGIFIGTDTEAPTAPTNLVASNPSISSIDLSWDAATDNIGVTEYHVYVDDVFLYSTPNTTYTVSFLSSDTNYCFKIVATDLAANTSGFSNTDCETTLENSNPNSCLTESFSNVGSTNTSQYTSRTWTGDEGGEWNATDARIDQTITGSAVTVRNGLLIAPERLNGIGNLTVSTQRVFSGSAGTFNLNVNGSFVATIPYDETVQTTTISNIDISGNVIISFTDNSGSGNRVTFDDLSWTCFPSLSIEDKTKNSFSFYPNPVQSELTLETQSGQATTYYIYNILGKLQSQGAFQGQTKINVSNLSSGIYLIKLESNGTTSTKKLIKN